ncbi:peptidoglycan DD-metalloendopeptidase family protein [Altererythrobacter aurantiacus]|uniref:Peptidoglycan DD-metalloendopeptidase family protein n=1 Tax=Parapontixanthobacter aurantiacus TaxID=1463599 RepID=A0A844ZD73_9SPHN|nr:peptidoglycan DD-metalloendopeptidase family protein [Parapontixanthobacter aurantiacus]MXO85153.1 peptidoglycan DD-metalloendopeptidase family protein [Parapontixanthobacter aurantiacus]
MALPIVDRMLTIVATATLTSAVWIIFGGTLMENASGESQRDKTRPAEAVGQSPPAAQLTEAAILSGSAPNPVLDREAPVAPSADETRNLLVPVLNIRRSDLVDTYEHSRGEGERLHEAIDIMAPKGTSVVAAGPGTIERLFFSDRGGNTIYVRSLDGRTIHYYAHLDDYARGLREGQRITRGQRLGTVGSSGNAEADAPHLHFQILRTTPESEWWEPASPINPYPLLSGS